MKTNELMDAAAADALKYTETGKFARLSVRVTEADKHEIKEIAESLGLNITEYLVMIHRAVWRRLHGNGKKKKGSSTVSRHRSRRGNS